MLVDEAALSRLAPLRFGRLLQLDEASSTNSIALERAQAGEPEGLVVVADYQSAGRGRFDRHWQSRAGTSLLFSVLMRPGLDVLAGPSPFLAVAALSLAIKDAARALTGAVLELKWPNDLLYGEAKVAGVLAEAAPAQGSLVVGAGLNVSWAPSGLGATSLEAAAGGPVDRALLLEEVLGRLDRLYGRWPEVGRRYQAECATVGRLVVVHRSDGQPDVQGQAEALAPDGALTVRSGGTYHQVRSGDVFHLGRDVRPNL